MFVMDLAALVLGLTACVAIIALGIRFLLQPRQATLDFGIADEDRLIHVSAADLAQRLPAPEKQRWLTHVAALPVSGTFLVMRLGAGHCMDDGDVRDWQG